MLEVFEEEDILGTCMKREQEMRNRLNTLFGSSKHSSNLREVRGRGLMIGNNTELAKLFMNESLHCLSIQKLLLRANLHEEMRCLTR